jgi:hypothetical protein
MSPLPCRERGEMSSHPPRRSAAIVTFFGKRPVADWFNRATPRVKSGEIVPELLDANTALPLML